MGHPGQNSDTCLARAEGLVVESKLQTKKTGIMPFVDLSALTQREIVKGYRARMVHGERVTLAFWEIDPEHPLPEHRHEHEQVVVVQEGRLQLTVSGQTHVLEPGQVYVIPPNVPHSAVALTPCRVLDVFSPVREDYL